MTPHQKGERLGVLCEQKAVSRNSTFTDEVEKEILALLSRENLTGEELVDLCKASGIRPHDDRAFGPVFGRLSRASRIKHVGFTTRAKGHGTGGARIWALV